MGSKYVTSIGGGGYEGNHEKSFKDFAKKNKSPHSKALERKKISVKSEKSRPLKSRTYGFVGINQHKQFGLGK